MLDRPDAASLLTAMAETLSSEVLPATSGVATHSVRVVANLCRILAREIRDGDEARELTRQSLVELIGREAPLEDLVHELDRQLGERPDDTDLEARAARLILADVRRRLAIDKPDYDA
jgi:hypothetical protein